MENAPSQAVSKIRERDLFWIVLIFSTAALLWMLWTMAWDPRWLGHLRIDPLVFHTRAVSFLEHASWEKTGTNEYQPGALWYFVAAASGLEDPRHFDAFLQALFVANSLLLCLHILLAAVFGGKHSPWILLILAAASGPILLYRFELLVSLLVLVGWLFWRSGHFNACGFFMGLAMATKIYPVLIAPLLLGNSWLAGKSRKAASTLIAWGAGLFGMVLSLAVFGAQSRELMSAIRFHFDKPIGIDGFLGSLIPVLQNLLGIPLRMAPRNGIHGFDSDLGVLPTAALGWLWLPIAMAVILLIFRSQNKTLFPNAGGLFVLFGVYVGLGKLMAPQYTWWAISLLPFVPEGWLSKKEWCAVMLLLVSSLLIGQFVYPLNYSEFIESFSKSPLENRLFWINALKNLLWLAAVGLVARRLIVSSFKP
jgi:hypothetical protein